MTPVTRTLNSTETTPILNSNNYSREQRIAALVHDLFNILRVYTNRTGIALAGSLTAMGLLVTWMIRNLGKTGESPNTDNTLLFPAVILFALVFCVLCNCCRSSNDNGKPSLIDPVEDDTNDTV